jgi:hypothetical protein
MFHQVHSSEWSTVYSSLIVHAMVAVNAPLGANEPDAMQVRTVPACGTLGVQMACCGSYRRPTAADCGGSSERRRESERAAQLTAASSAGSDPGGWGLHALESQRHPRNAGYGLYTPARLDSCACIVQG